MNPDQPVKTKFHFGEFLKISFLSLTSLTILTGVFYPLFMTALGQILFPIQANGSLVFKDNKVIGSEVLGQLFEEEKYFWGRPSATSPYPYNAASSKGSNLGPTNPLLLNVIKSRIERFQKTDPTNHLPIPIELLTASASGLDPHISPRSAYYQAQRIASVRRVSIEKVKELISDAIELRQLGVLGEPRVNVLKLNL